MRGVLCNAFDGIEALTIGEAEEPRPQADEVLVDVHAASVSYADYLMICGGYQMRPALPYVPGTDAASVVVACGDQVTRFRPGDRVSCENWFGSFAERMVAKATMTTHLPANVDFVVGSTIMQSYLTAWYALIERARLQAGETVLVTGAAGGIGLASVELAHLLGARVIAVVGSPAKGAIVREYGADGVIDHSRENVRQRVKVLTADEGLDVCVENVGGGAFRHPGPAHALERAADADRIHQRRDSFSGDESAPAQEFFNCWRLRRRLDGTLSGRRDARRRDGNGLGRRRQTATAH